MKRLAHLLQFVLIISISLPVAVLPLRAAYIFGDMLGAAGFFLWRSRRKIAIENIAEAVRHGHLPSSLSPGMTAYRSFLHMGKSLVEIIKIYFNLGGRILRSVEMEGTEHYRKAASLGRGVILVTGHYGNWELAGLSISHRLAPVSVVARQQENSYLNNHIEKVRAKFGNSVIYKAGALRKILALLKSGGVTGILFDQSVIESEGILIDFLGRKAWAMKMPVILSRKTGAPLLPLFIKRTRSGHSITIHPPYLPDRSEDLRHDVEYLHERLSEHITDDPAQWLWIHRRWKRT